MLLIVVWIAIKFKIEYLNPIGYTRSMSIRFAKINHY